MQLTFFCSNELVAFKAEHGHCDVSRTKDRTSQYERLANWVDTQRVRARFLRSCLELRCMSHWNAAFYKSHT